MPVHHAGPYLEPALDCVLAQQASPEAPFELELIAVDDGSTDGSAARLTARAARDSRLRVLTHPVNRGIATSRNTALDAARGECVAFLNHDDLCAPERTALQLEFLAHHPEIAAVGTQVAHVDATGAHLTDIRLGSTTDELRWFGLLDCPIRQSALLLRRSALPPGLLRYDEGFVSNSDYEFISRLVRAVPCANLPERLTRYRKHATNTSRVRHALFVEAGAVIARREIAATFPALATWTLEEVRELRAIVLGYLPAGFQRTLSVVARATDRFLDLQEAWIRLHPGFGRPAVPLAGLSLP
jgi:glycosyltransferase involved in cell wall biosynthesis